MNFQQKHLSPKILILGDTGVGKTTLVNYIKEGPMRPRPHHVSVGAEFTRCSFLVDNRTVKPSIWDTAGSERYRCANSIYYRESQGALLVADLSCLHMKEVFPGDFEESLTADLTYWVEQFKAKAHPNGKLFLVGNKIDLEIEPATLKILQKFAKEHNLPFFTMSAVTGENVDLIMDTLLRSIISDPALETKIKAKSAEMTHSTRLPIKMSIMMGREEKNEKTAKKKAPVCWFKPLCFM